MEKLRRKIADVIGIKLTDATPVNYTVLESVKEEGYTRQKIEYASGGDKIPAFLLLPDTLDNNPAILINHQHNREHHLGKSEVCGLAGDPLQAFGPELARRGFVVLAPDAICFEERRKDPNVDGFDFWQHFDEMCYRILKGEYLMKKVLEDAMNGISLLSGLEFVDKSRIGTLGHSMGGNTVLFLAALDERIAYSCASGSVCTYENRMKNGVGIEMSSVIPGFCNRYDIDDLVSCVAPRKILLVSAEDDKYSKDADYIVEKADVVFGEYEVAQHLYHKRFPGGHALTQERFDFIVKWIDAIGKNKSEKIVSNYYRYYKSFAESGIVDCHEEAVSWIVPKEGEKGPSLGYGIFLDKETAEAEIKKLTEKIRNKQAPQNWIITPDCTPANLIEILERNGFQNMATDDSEPEPAMLLEKNEFQPYSTSEDGIVCRKVQTQEDFRSWIEIVNTALHGWEMIDADNYYAWVENENIDIYLGEIYGIPVATAATIRHGDMASLEFVSTLEEYRRKKVASVVCSTALTDLFESGVEDVTLSACGESVYLYEKFGFQGYFNNVIMRYEI